MTLETCSCCGQQIEPSATPPPEPWEPSQRIEVRAALEPQLKRILERLERVVKAANDAR